MAAAWLHYICGLSPSVHLWNGSINAILCLTLSLVTLANLCPVVAFYWPCMRSNYIYNMPHILTGHSKIQENYSTSTWKSKWNSTVWAHNVAQMYTAFMAPTSQNNQKRICKSCEHWQYDSGLWPPSAQPSEITRHVHTDVSLVFTSITPSSLPSPEQCERHASQMGHGVDPFFCSAGQRVMLTSRCRKAKERLSF